MHDHGGLDATPPILVRELIWPQDRGAVVACLERFVLRVARIETFFWIQVLLERLRDDQHVTLAYNLFAVSRADLAKIQELEHAFFRDLRQPPRLRSRCRRAG